MICGIQQLRSEERVKHLVWSRGKAVGRTLTEQKTRPEGREGRVFRRLNELMQRLLHPGRERGRLPVLTPTTATMAVKKATPMQECVCLCVR